MLGDVIGFAERTLGYFCIDIAVLFFVIYFFAAGKCKAIEKLTIEIYVVYLYLKNGNIVVGKG